MSAFIQLDHLSKHYRDNVVLENLNCEVREGEFVTLVGASGCGKSTFLRLLLGTESVSSGQLLMAGKPIEQEPSPDRGIVFQRYSVFPHLNVRENVVLGIEFVESKWLGRLFGKRRKDALAQADELLAAVGLEQARFKYPHELSGGMQQRLALAQALIKRPKILLLDEPFGALDPGIRKEMHELVMGLWRQYGLTIFMVTHDLKEGFELGTRLWVFDKVRVDPHAPNRFGSTITYDLSLNSKDKALKIAALDEIKGRLHTADRTE
ncbi:ABC transporter ATP-binding protein [Gammaproteobacteria bacterium LSUCC0112]|nr:ABC transporter ATP-binding protein [Gammaproteobacteria bacterium LSUCC0112]